MYMLNFIYVCEYINIHTYPYIYTNTLNAHRNRLKEMRAAPSEHHLTASMAALPDIYSVGFMTQLL